MRKIAICGKGGSGKSVLSRLLAGGLRSRGFRPLVVDADESNTGLHRMMGFKEPPRSLLEFMGGKQELEKEIERQIKAGATENRLQLMGGKVRISDIPPDYIRETPEGVRFVVVGKVLMALEGCACPMGIVSRSFLKSLVLENNEVVVVDLEAGVEHFGRGVETSMDCVLVVVEPSIDSLDLAEKIKEMSAQIQIADVWGVLNKITSEEIAAKLNDYLEKRGIQAIGTIHQDPEIFASCLEGRPIRGKVAMEDITKIIDFLFP